MLSAEKQAQRKRRTVVNFQITFISWILELLAGFIILIARMAIDHNNHQLRALLWFADHCLTFVLVPCTYIVNNEATKEAAVTQSWYEGLRNTFNLKHKTEEDAQSQNHSPPHANQNHANQALPAGIPPNKSRDGDSSAVEDLEEGETSVPPDK